MQEGGSGGGGDGGAAAAAAQAQAAAAQAAAAAREAEAEAARQAAIAEQMRLEAERREREEEIRTNTQEQIGQRLGRSVAYDEITYSNRQNAWVLKADLLEEQKAARINLAAAAGVPPYIFSMKEDCAVNLGHNPSYSLSDWSSSSGTWGFSVLEKYCFSGTGFDAGDGRFYRNGGHSVNTPKDLAPWKTLAAALQQPFNAIPWDDYVWCRGGKTEIIFHRADLLDSILEKGFSGVNGIDDKGRLLLSYSGKEDRVFFLDDLKHWKVNYRPWDKPYNFSWNKDMPLPKICGNCGIPSLPGVKFCGSCGSPLK
jgi:hypothetical protein